MANLRGGTLRKQAKEAFHRMEKFGQSRYRCKDHGTHSLELAKKRTMYLSDIVKFLESIEETGKINLHLSDEELMGEFFEQRLEKLKCQKSAGDYMSGWSSMIKSLIEENITIEDDAFDIIDRFKEVAKSKDQPDFRIGRSIEKPYAIIEQLYKNRFESGVLAQIQYELGYRIAEAYELAENHRKYIFENEVQGLIGKGKHIYPHKKISPELIRKLALVKKLPDVGTYRKHIKQITNNPLSIPHDFRVTYAKREFMERIEAGMPYDDALFQVSELLNHHRLEMTIYYIKRA